MVYLNTNRNGYCSSQCGRTLTVSELIEILENFNGDEKVFFRNDNGYTYGSIDESDISDYDSQDEA